MPSIVASSFADMRASSTASRSRVRNVKPKPLRKTVLADGVYGGNLESQLTQCGRVTEKRGHEQHGD